MWSGLAPMREATSLRVARNGVAAVQTAIFLTSSGSDTWPIPRTSESTRVPARTYCWPSVVGRTVNIKHDRVFFAHRAPREDVFVADYSNRPVTADTSAAVQVADLVVMAADLIAGNETNEDVVDRLATAPGAVQRSGGP